MSAPIIWEDVDARLGRFLSDEENPDADEAYLYNQALRIDSWNQAQRVLAQQHTPRQLSAVLTMDSARVAILPEDFIAIWRLYDADEQRWLRSLDNPQPGAVRHDDDELAAYWIWGKQLLFEKTIALSSTALPVIQHYYMPLGVKR